MSDTPTETPTEPEAPPTEPEAPAEGDGDPEPKEGVEGDEANANGGPTWQHERFSQSYPESGRPDDDEQPTTEEPTTA